jgi:hypothetical protein
VGNGLCFSTGEDERQRERQLARLNRPFVSDGFAGAIKQFWNGFCEQLATAGIDRTKKDFSRVLFGLLKGCG